MLYYMSHFCYEQDVRPSVRSSVTLVDCDQTASAHSRIGRCLGYTGRIVVSCDPDFYRRGPVGYGKLRRNANRRHPTARMSRYLERLVYCATVTCSRGTPQDAIETVSLLTY